MLVKEFSWRENSAALGCWMWPLCFLCYTAGTKVDWRLKEKK